MKLKILLGTTLISASLFGCQQAEPSNTTSESPVSEETPSTSEEQQGQEEEAVETSAQENESDESNKEETDINTSEGTEQPEEDEPTATEEDESREKTSSNGVVTVEDPTSLQVLVNKNRKLPDGYEPADLVAPDVPFYFEEDIPKRYMRAEAAAALEELFAGAEQDGLNLVAASGYRSYERQKQLYEGYVEQNGQEEADKFSARPGTSEHQTGLAMDVTSAEMAFALEQTFKQTDEGSWLAENAHRYGFIIRYPEGKSNITGYSYEPWHIRYVGKEVAKEIYERDITLEEYFN